MTHRHGHPFDSVFLFDDRRDAGAVLARELARIELDDAVVVGLGGGGVAVAAVAAQALGLALDVVSVRRVRHPGHPEYTVGAVAAGGTPAIRDGRDGLTEAQLALAVTRARNEAAEIDARFHQDRAAVSLNGRAVVLIDDGLSTGSKMRAAVQWAVSRGARRVIAAAPVGARPTVSQLEDEVDTVVCPYPVDDLIAIGLWYEDFGRVSEHDVAVLLAESSLGAPVL